MHQNELPTALLTAVTVNMQRDPSKGEPAKASDFCYYDRKADGPKLSGQCCDTFFSLIREQKMPGWTLNIVPIEQLKRGQVGGAIRYPRAWIGAHIVLINPSIDQGKIKASLAIIDETRSDMVMPVKDLDNGEMFGLTLPKGLQRYIVDAEFYLN